MSFEFLPSDFAEVAPFWRDFLWPHRESLIEPVSAIGENGIIEMAWLAAEPRFWKIEQHGKIVGVVSALFLSRARSVRLRGIWVDHEFRGKGLGKEMIEKVVAEFGSVGCDRLWTMARVSAALFYQSCGFINPRMIKGFEFGPHVLLERSITDST